MRATSTASMIGREGPHYLPTIHWACERDGIHSRIHIFNYYELIGRTPVPARLEIHVFDEQGRERGSLIEDMPSDSARVVEVRDIVRDPSPFSGSITAIMRPLAKFPAPDKGRTLTEYYVTYHSDRGALDMVHQTSAVEDRDTENDKELPQVLEDERYEASFAIQNSYFGSRGLLRHASRPYLRLYNWKGEEHVVDLPPIPARGATLVRLRDVFPGSVAFFGGRTGSAIVGGVNVSRKPSIITRDTTTGDFTIDHA